MSTCTKCKCKLALYCPWPGEPIYISVLRASLPLLRITTLPTLGFWCPLQLQFQWFHRKNRPKCPTACKPQLIHHHTIAYCYKYMLSPFNHQNKAFHHDTPPVSLQMCLGQQYPDKWHQEESRVILTLPTPVSCPLPLYWRYMAGSVFMVQEQEENMAFTCFSYRHVIKYSPFLCHIFWCSISMQQSTDKE